MKTMFFLILFVNFSSLLISQVNTEKFKFDDFQNGFTSELSLGLDWESGNTEAADYSGELGMNYITNSQRTYFISMLNYKEGAGIIYKSRSLYYLASELRLFNNFNPDIFLQANNNKFLEIQERYLIGGHIKIDLFNVFSQDSSSKIFIFNIGPGLMWEYEKYYLEKEPISRLFRTSTYLNIYWVVTDLLKLYNTTYWQSDIERFNDYRILSDATINFSLTKNFSIIINIHYRYDSEPLKDLKNYDFEIKQGFSFKF